MFYLNNPKKTNSSSIRQQLVSHIIVGLILVIAAISIFTSATEKQATIHVLFKPKSPLITQSILNNSGILTDAIDNTNRQLKLAKESRFSNDILHVSISPLYPKSFQGELTLAVLDSQYKKVLYPFLDQCFEIANSNQSTFELISLEPPRIQTKLSTWFYSFDTTDWKIMSSKWVIYLTFTIIVTLINMLIINIINIWSALNLSLKEVFGIKQHLGLLKTHRKLGVYVLLTVFMTLELLTLMAPTTAISEGQVQVKTTLTNADPNYYYDVLQVIKYSSLLKSFHLYIDFTDRSKASQKTATIQLHSSHPQQAQQIFTNELSFIAENLNNNLSDSQNNQSKFYDTLKSMGVREISITEPLKANGNIGSQGIGYKKIAFMVLAIILGLTSVYTKALIIKLSDIEKKSVNKLFLHH